jgi:hypothetical protein
VAQVVIVLEFWQKGKPYKQKAEGPPNLGAIASGAYDDLIDAFADVILAHGNPEGLWIRPRATGARRLFGRVRSICTLSALTAGLIVHLSASDDAAPPVITRLGSERRG